MKTFETLVAEKKKQLIQDNLDDIQNHLQNSDYQQKVYNLCFTNYRDRNRKRIGFKEAYDFASLSYDLVKKGS